MGAKLLQNSVTFCFMHVLKDWHQLCAVTLATLLHSCGSPLGLA